MKVLDSIILENEKYTCIGILCIDDKTVYKVYNQENEIEKYVEEKGTDFEVITDKNTLEKLDILTNPPTDVDVAIKQELNN